MLPEAEKWLKGINGKDEKAWKALFDVFYVPLCHHGMRILKDKEATEDVVQEIMVRLWKGNLRFENEKAFTTYIYRSVTNNCLKYLRDKNVQEKRLHVWRDETEEATEEEFASVVQEELFRKLRTLINELPFERRKILLMSMEGMSGDEIARQLGVTIFTVKQQKYRAYQYIKSRWGEFWGILLLVILR